MNKVTVNYNPHNDTFDVFHGDNCVFYGDVDKVSKWLSDGQYQESQTTLNEYLRSDQTSE